MNMVTENGESILHPVSETGHRAGRGGQSHVRRFVDELCTREIDRVIIFS